MEIVKSKRKDIDSDTSQLEGELNKIVFDKPHDYFYDKSKPNGQKQKDTHSDKFHNFCKEFNFELTPLKYGLEQTINYFINTFENNPKSLKL